MRLRPETVAFGCNEPPLNIIEIRQLQTRICIRIICGSAAARLIDYVNSIALTQEELRPSFPAVGRACEVGTGLPEAVNHHDRVRMRSPSGNLEFGIKLTGECPAILHRRIFSAGEQVALLSDREWRQ